MKGPVGITEHLASEEDEIGPALGDDCVGLMRVGDHANCGSGNGSFGADARGKGSLETGTDGDSCVRSQAARGDVDEVDAVSAKMASESDGLIGGPAAFNPVGGRDADKEGEVGRPCGSDGIDDLQEEACAAFEAAAVSIGALIGERREELMQQIAVSGMDLNEVEASGEGPLCRLREGRDHGVDAGLVKRLRDSVVRSKGDCAWGGGLPATFRRWDSMFSACEGRGHGGFASGVGQLDAGANSLGMDEVDDALQAGDVVVLVDAQVVRRNAAFGNDG